MRLLLIFLLIPLNTYAKLEDLFDGETNIEKPFELRDPFQAPKFKSARKKLREKESTGYYERNVLRFNQDLNLDNIEIVGVLIGKKRRVMIKSGGAEVYTLSEGEKLGNNGPEIKAILAGGIVLVEKIVNIYDEPEFIETVVPISR